MYDVNKVTKMCSEYYPTARFYINVIYKLVRLSDVQIPDLKNLSSRGRACEFTNLGCSFRMGTER